MVVIVEKWKAVSGYEGAYEVSDSGRVKSLSGGHRQARVLSPGLPKAGYRAVMLHKDGKRVRRAVHVLVGLAFLPLKPTSRHEIRHLDGNRDNNRADNLKWGTGGDNAKDREVHGRTARGVRHGMYGVALAGQANGYAKLTDNQVREIRRLAGSMSQRAIARKFGVHQGSVWKIIHRKSWAHVE